MVLPKIAVVIPAYKAQDQILRVLEDIPNFVDKILVVDDACPSQTGTLVASQTKDPRVEVIFNKTNLGVGGAVLVGYQKALDENHEIVIKVDADGQMDLQQMSALIKPILAGEADYTKGNRFDSLEDLEQMPRARIIGNAGLSLMSKLSTGYWDINDPTNGYTAIHRSSLSRIALQKVRKTFFFESDMLFRLSLIRAVVVDVPMRAIYGSETSNLRIGRAIWEFPRRHGVNFFKRISDLYRLTRASNQHSFDGFWNYIWYFHLDNCLKSGSCCNEWSGLVGNIANNFGLSVISGIP